MGGWRAELDGWAAIVGAPAAAVLGAYAGQRLRVPAGPFTGAMAGVGLWLTLLGFPELRTPRALNQALQVMVGVLVGLRITGDSLRSGVRTLPAATVLAVVFLASGVAAAIAAVLLTGTGLVTALFAAAPGGLTEMASVGASLGADGPAVAAVHLARLLLVILAANLLLARLRSTPHVPGEPVMPTNGSDGGSEREGLLKLCAIAGAGLAGGVLGLTLTSLPAGGVVGALVGSGLVRVAVAGAVPERVFNFFVQAFGGGVIGLGLSPEFFGTLARLAGVTLLVNSTQMAVWAFAAYMLVRLFRFDARTATFAAAPGGMGILLSITGETDADLVSVAFIHLFRLTATIIVVPLLVAAIF